MIPWLIGAAGLGFFGFLLVCWASERFTAWVLGRGQDEGQPEKSKDLSDGTRRWYYENGQLESELLTDGTIRRWDEDGTEWSL